MGGSAVNPVDHQSTRHSRGAGAYAFVPSGRVHIRGHSWEYHSWD
jgi:hypothetical protein